MVSHADFQDSNAHLEYLACAISARCRPSKVFRIRHGRIFVDLGESIDFVFEPSLELFQHSTIPLTEGSWSD